jgi:hypothetical protein
LNTKEEMRMSKDVKKKTKQKNSNKQILNLAKLYILKKQERISFLFLLKKKKIYRN